MSSGSQSPRVSPEPTSPRGNMAVSRGGRGGKKGSKKAKGVPVAIGIRLKSKSRSPPPAPDPQSFRGRGGYQRGGRGRSRSGGRRRSRTPDPNPNAARSPPRRGSPGNTGRGRGGNTASRRTRTVPIAKARVVHPLEPTFFGKFLKAPRKINGSMLYALQFPLSAEAKAKSEKYQTYFDDMLKEINFNKERAAYVHQLGDRDFSIHLLTFKAEDKSKVKAVEEKANSLFSKHFPSQKVDLKFGEFTTHLDRRANTKYFFELDYSTEQGQSFLDFQDELFNWYLSTYEPSVKYPEKYQYEEVRTIDRVNRGTSLLYVPTFVPFLQYLSPGTKTEQFERINHIKLFNALVKTDISSRFGEVSLQNLGVTELGKIGSGDDKDFGEERRVPGERMGAGHNGRGGRGGGRTAPVQRGGRNQVPQRGRGRGRGGRP